MTVLVAAVLVALLVGAAVGFVIGSRNAYRIVARLTPAKKVEFARKVSRASR